MATVKSDLNFIQARLHDNGVLWPREELLRWWNDGYRQLLAESQAVRHFLMLDVPGRFSYTFSHEWEDRHIRGTALMPFMPGLDATYRCTAAWEVEHAENVPPSAAYGGLTQLWERTMMADSDRHFRFALPKHHERLVRVAWDHRTLHPISVRELDSDTRWWQRGGEPLWWTMGMGRIHSLEIYEIRTDYQQSYEHQQFEQGIPRAITPGGSRTYGVAVNSLTAAQSFAYTHSGDVQALTVSPIGFAPLSAITDEFERSFAPSPAYRFTLLTDASLDRFAGTQLWELGGDPTVAGSARGCYAFERLDPLLAWDSTVPTPDDGIVLPGLGWRFTQPARTNGQSLVGELGFCTQAWEVQQMEGTTIGAGAAIGSAAWEQEDIALTIPLFGVGTIRAMTSNNRQYLAQGSGPSSLVYGGARQFSSTDLSLWITHVVIPETDLAETDVPDMIPAPLQKYLRAYVWSHAFGRPGEGTHPMLGEHYLQRFQRGVKLLRRVADLGQRDRVAVRENVGAPDRTRPPRVRLPSTFERVW